QGVFRMELGIAPSREVLLTALQPEGDPGAPAMRCVAVSPDGKTAFSADTFANLRQLSTEGGRDLPEVQDAERLIALAATPDSHGLFAASRQLLQYLRLASGRGVRVAEWSGELAALAVSPDGRWLAAGVDADVQLWYLRAVGEGVPPGGLVGEQLSGHSA